MIRVKGQFVHADAASLEKAIQQHFRKNVIRVMDYDDKEAELRVSEETHDGKLSVDMDIKLAYKKMLCEKCYKIKCSYYEAMFQLRGDPIRISKILKYSKSYFERNNEFISKVEQKDGGTDVYLSNKKLANAFVAYYKLYPKMSYILSGLKGGKKQYKNIYAMHL